MTTIATPAITTQLLAVLREAFEGPQDRWTYFTDNRPESGLFGTLATLSSAQASRPSGPSGTTVAGHVHHLAFSSAASASWIRGERKEFHWDESWQVRAVTDAEWAALKERLQGEYRALIEAVEQHALDSEESLGGAIGAVAHTAYHLAVVRHKATAK